MRIVHFIGAGNLPSDPDTSASSGIVRVPLELAWRQVAIGHDVTVMSTSDALWQTTWRGVRLLSLRRMNYAKLRWRKKYLDFSRHVPIVAYSRTHGIDVLHCHGYSYLRGVRAATRVVHFHSDPLYSPDNRAVDSPDGALVSKLSDAQIAVSGYISRQAKEFLGSSSCLYTVLNGSNTAPVAEHAGTLDGFRHQVGIQSASFVFSFAGAIIQEKGVIYLAQAFVEAAKVNPRIELMLAGDSDLWEGDRENSTRVRYREVVLTTLRTLGGRVHFLGKLPSSEMPSLYALTDVLVVPSCWPEPCPLSLFEAMTMGKPVIASDVGGLPELVTADRGLLVPPGDVTALRDAMLSLASDPKQVAQLGESARIFTASWTWDDVVAKVMDIYRQNGLK